MILVLGGTTEGRLAVQVLDEAGSPYFYSTRGEGQEMVCRHGRLLTGALDREAMRHLCETHAIRLLVDAAHPFAARLHQTVAEVAQALRLPVIRVERNYPPRDPSLIWCADFTEAVQRLQADGVENLLALTGVQTIGRLRPYWQAHRCHFRILSRASSQQLALQEGFDPARLLYYPESGTQREEDEERLFATLRPGAILTKESGESGGFSAKVEAARRLRIPVYVVARPALPEGFRRVTGAHGLRRAVEQAVPGFFPLRSGLTTGTCATAAAKAALIALLGGVCPEELPVELPDGETVEVPVARVSVESPQAATAQVVKEAGDDPDVTNGRRVVVRVAFSEEPGICFLRGEGVGIVTLPGLGLEVGGPAINPVPRQMMVRELSRLYPGGLEVTVSIPGGRELAQKTFNGRVGVVEGLSILGTSGVVRPFSSEAFVESIRREIAVCQAIGAERLVIVAGAKSEEAMRLRYPELPPQAFVHYGNFVGEAILAAAEAGFRQVTLGIMLGKAVKLAEGHLDTHSHKVVMNKQFLKQVAAESGCPEAAVQAIDTLTLARELPAALGPEAFDRFRTALVAHCHLHCDPLLPQGDLEILLTS